MNASGMFAQTQNDLLKNQIKQLTAERNRLRAALEKALKGILFYSTEGAAKAGIDAANEALKGQP